MVDNILGSRSFLAPTCSGAYWMPMQKPNVLVSCGRHCIRTVHLYAGELELTVHVGTDSTPSFPWAGSVPDSACALVPDDPPVVFDQEKAKNREDGQAIINYFGFTFLGSLYLLDKVRARRKDNVYGHC